MSAEPSPTPDYLADILVKVEAKAKARKERRRALWNKNIAREVRMVAWIDILGFSDQLLAAKTDEEYQAAYRNMLKVHEEFGHPHANADPEEQGEVNRNFGRSALALSDGIVVTATTDALAQELMPPYALYLDFIEDLMWAQANCALNGVFVRGGISFGPFHYEDDMLLSPALVRAFRLESKKACYPVIIIDANELAQAAKATGHDPAALPVFLQPFESPTQEKTDKFLFIDYLGYVREPANHGWFSDADREAWGRASGPDRDRIHWDSHLREAVRLMGEHKKQLLEKHGATTDDRVKSKFRWLMEYHNLSLRDFPPDFAPARIDPSAWAKID